MKNFLALVLALALSLSVAAVPAYAADEDSFQTDVTYTVPEPEVCTYTLEIPSSLTLSPEFKGTIQIFPTSVQIPESKQVVVRISESTFSGGSFFLYKNKGTDNEARISANLSSGNQYLTGGETIVTFQNGDSRSSASPGAVGVSTSPYNYQSASPGTYTGSVYFSVSVENK